MKYLRPVHAILLSIGLNRDVVLMINLYLIWIWPLLNSKFSSISVPFLSLELAILWLLWWWCLLGQHLYNIYPFYKTVAIEKNLLWHFGTNETSPLLLVENFFFFFKRNNLGHPEHLGRKKKQFMHFFQVCVVTLSWLKIADCSFYWRGRIQSLCS